jgi:hypothetical protein
VRDGSTDHGLANHDKLREILGSAQSKRQRGSMSRRAAPIPAVA